MPRKFETPRIDTPITVDQLPHIPEEGATNPEVPKQNPERPKRKERTETGRKGKETEGDKDTTNTEIAEVKETIQQIGDENASQDDKHDPALYGAFAGERTKSGTIALAPDAQKEVQRAITQHKKANRFSLPSLLIGAKTATGYDSRARNFSTRNTIATLPDGRRVFVVYNYPSSWIHRTLDTFGKWTAGARMRKAESAQWKRAYEAKSNIPIIETDDPNVVLMPFIENMNANDVFAFNHEIKDFGVLPEAKDAGVDEKMEYADRIVDELANIHAKGAAWGEAILANMIITEGGKPVIVDPEVRYNKDVPLTEQKARDLRDLTMSIVSALRQSKEEFDVRTVVERVVGRHPDAAVRAELRQLAQKKPSFIRKLLRPIHELPRLGIKGSDYDKVVEAMAAL
jgi:tRNA A-37 threonylcarbamoyl transferase component Bud32